MTWFRRKRRGVHERPAKKVESPRMVTTDEEIVRAENAAKVAALHLQAARDRRPKVEEVDAALRDLNKENGFAELIRNAFGS